MVGKLSPFPTITCPVSTTHLDISFHFHTGIEERLRALTGRAMRLALSCGSSVTELVPELSPAAVEQAAWWPRTGCPAMAQTSVLGVELNIANLGHLVDST